MVCQYNLLIRLLMEIYKSANLRIFIDRIEAVYFSCDGSLVVLHL
jgi:hypothetical protein